ncbi:MAG: helix-turn-helix transcriptional regulator [Methylococcales bacterium]|nr:helix-turn-helix transcriptional regulator [Methylococcales bacterium]
MKQTKPASETSWRISTEDLSSLQLTDRIQQDLPEGLGHGKTDIFHIDQGLSYMDTRLNPAKNLAIMSRIEQQAPRLVVTLALKGRSCFKTTRGNECLFKEGYTTITSFNSTLGERRYKANKEILQLRFSLSEAWLQKYYTQETTANFFKTANLSILSHQPISSHAMFAAQQLIKADVPNISKKMLIHGQALSILATELTSLCVDNQSSPRKYNKNDINIVKQARNILESEFKTPPAVELLAQRVGTNQFKLKQLFHFYYATTPYAFLYEVRMKIAYKMLESRHCYVNEVADFVGYQHASNFSSAFIKYFGVSPKHITKEA